MKKSTITIIIGSVVAVLGALGVITSDEATKATEITGTIISAVLGVVELVRGIKFRIEGKKADEATLDAE